MRSRRSRRAIWVVPALLIVAGAAIPRGTSAPPVTPLQVRGSVGQIAATHATPGAPLQLRDGANKVVGEMNADAQGSALWRDLTPGDGFHVVQLDGTETGPIHVLTPDELPSQSFYANQQLANGFGYITTRDGTKLSVTVHLPGPAANGPYPTVVEYSGYAASNPNAPQPSTQIAQVLGYATVAVNIRGTGCSGGAFSYFETLQGLDGYDVIETVAAQPWVAHGKVGMVGISYPGISQLFVARTQPPHLAAIAPLSVIDDTYRSTLYPGGIFNNGFALNWAKERMDQAKPYGQGWEQGIVDAGGANGAQCAEDQLLRLQNVDLLDEIAKHPFEDTAYDGLAPVTFADKFNTPVFLGGAWQDEQTGGHFTAMWSKFATKTKLFATNGTHVDSLLADLNRWYEFVEFYVAQRIPQVPANVRAIAPALIKSQVGIDGVQLEPDRFTSYPTYADALAAYEAEAPVRILMENGAGDPSKPGAPLGTFELNFPSWPPPQTQAAAWYFQPDQHLAPSAPAVPDNDGRASSSYIYDPSAKPATDFTGSTSEIWGATPAYDWKPPPAGRALAFDSGPLGHETVMAGSGSVDLWLRSSAPDTDVEVTLTDLRPDGKEMYVQSGWLRASHRALDATQSTDLRPWPTHLEADAAPLPAGQFVSARVELFPFAHVFRPGSRIRITVEAPGGNRPFWTFDALQPNGKVVNDIAHSIGHPSRVVLPVIPNVDAPDALPACPSLRGEPCRTAVSAPQPVNAHAVIAADDATVTWDAPTAQPGVTINAYRVTEQPGDKTKDVDVNAGANTVEFTNLTAGPHFFTVEARYAGGKGSGPSTGSNSVLAAAAEVTTTTTMAPTTTTTNRANAELSTTTTVDSGDRTDNFVDDTSNDFSTDPLNSDTIGSSDLSCDSSSSSTDFSGSDNTGFSGNDLFGGDFNFDPSLFGDSSDKSSFDASTFNISAYDETTDTGGLGPDPSALFNDPAFQSDPFADVGSSSNCSDFSSFANDAGPLAFTGGNGHEDAYAAGILLCFGGLLVLLTRRPQTRTQRRS